MIPTGGWPMELRDDEIAEIDRIVARIAASAFRWGVPIPDVRGYLIALVLLHKVPRGVI